MSDDNKLSDLSRDLHDRLRSMMEHTEREIAAKRAAARKRSKVLLTFRCITLVVLAFAVYRLHSVSHTFMHPAIAMMFFLAVLVCTHLYFDVQSLRRP